MAFSSSSSSSLSDRVSEDATDCGLRDGSSCLSGERPIASFEDVMTRSDSLSLSSYSSWLLFPPAVVILCPVPIENWPPPRERLFCRLCSVESCCTVRPVVIISSFTEDKDVDEGPDAISIHDSVQFG